MTRTNLSRMTRHERGFTLIELMIGVALGLIILAALTTFFASTSANRNEIERTSRQIENGRYAVDALRNEIHLAGFYAELVQAGANFQMPDPCVSPVTTASLGFVLAGNLIPLPISGYSSDAATMPACITDRVPGTDVLVIRRFNTETTPAAGAPNTQFYWQPSRCASDSTATPWAFDVGGSGSFALKNTACSAVNDLYRYRVIVFYLRTWSLAAGDGIPTLVKLDLDQGAMSVIPLVEGIQDLRFSYGIDNDGDGTPDVFSRCDTASPCTVAQWSNVTTVDIHVLAENLDATPGYTDTKVYDMGIASGDHANPVGPFNDKIKRHVYAAVVSAPNRVGPRESS